MIEREHVVAAILAAAGGRLVSRVRLQKTAYLLDALGFKSGFRYEYHHYGPYSRDLDNAIADAKAFDLINEQVQKRQSDGASYSVFVLTPGSAEQTKAQMPEILGTLEADRAAELTRTFADTNVTVLELAATAHWLAREEDRPDWQTELRKRKGRKLEGGRLERALDLLKELDLPPADGMPLDSQAIARPGRAEEAPAR